jgi:hypothetical protein
VKDNVQSFTAEKGVLKRRRDSLVKFDFLAYSDAQGIAICGLLFG